MADVDAACSGGAMPGRPYSRSSRRSGARIGALMLIASGATLLAIAGWHAWGDRNGAGQAEAAPPYRYLVKDAAVPAEQLGVLSPLQARGVTVRNGVVLAPDSSRPMAEFMLASGSQGPVLLDWRSRVDDPFLRLLPGPDEVVPLSEVIARHLPAGATILGWWDLSRQLALIADLPVRFDAPLNVPLFFKAQSGAQAEAVARAEGALWSNGATRRADSPATTTQQEQADSFELFVDALLADEASGMQRLRQLAGERPAVLVLHVRDAILLGQMAPDRLGVAFRDFGDLADVHGTVKRVHAWLDEHRYPAYTVTRAKGQPVRAIALTDEASSQTLAARLLPMMGNRQDDVAGATLVYRVGGFSVYEIAPGR